MQMVELCHHKLRDAVMMPHLLSFLVPCFSTNFQPEKREGSAKTVIWDYFVATRAVDIGPTTTEALSFWVYQGRRCRIGTCCEERYSYKCLCHDHRSI